MVLDVHLAPQLERYLIEIVLASRDAKRYDPALARRIAWGASPRGSIALERCARARAWLAGRDYVTPDDIRAIAPDVLRHRVLPSYEATAEGWDGERLIAALLERFRCPDRAASLRYAALARHRCLRCRSRPLKPPPRQSLAMECAQRLQN